MAYRVQHRTAS